MPRSCAGKFRDHWDDPAWRRCCAWSPARCNESHTRRADSVDAVTEVNHRPWPPRLFDIPP